MPQLDITTFWQILSLSLAFNGGAVLAIYKLGASYLDFVKKERADTITALYDTNGALNKNSDIVAKLIPVLVQR